MTLPSWDSLPIRTKRSRKRLYGVIAAEYSLTAWKSLPHNVKRSKKHLYNYIASQKNLEEYDELAKNNMRSTRLLYNYIKANASGSKPTLTVKVKDGESNVSGATVTIGATEKSTDASGETTFSLDFDDYTVSVEKSGYEDYEEFIKFRANHKTFIMPLEAVKYKVSVTAKDGSANALSNASVSIKADSVVLATGLTGSDGKVELSVRSGTYTLEAISSDETLSYAGTLVVDGEESETITLTEPVETGTVTVTTVDSEDTPLTGSIVVMGTQALDDIANFETWAVTYGVGMGTTDSSGECTLTHFDPQTFEPTSDTSFEYGTYYITAMKYTDFNMNYEVVVDGDETETITLTSE